MYFVFGGELDPLFFFSLLCLVIFLIEFYLGERGSLVQLNSCVWFFVACGYWIVGERADTLSWDTIGIMALGVSLFWFGARMALLFPLKVPNFDQTRKLRPILVLAILFCVIIGLVGTAFKALDYAPYHEGVAIFGAGGSWYGDLRENLILYHNGSFGFWGYFLNISFVLTVFLIVSIRSRLDFLLAIVSFFISLVYAFFATGRTFIILLFVISLTALLTKQVIKMTSAISILVVTAFLVFFVSPLLSGRVGMDLIDYFLLYIAAGTSNFDWGIHGGFRCCSYGQNVFRSVFAILSKAGYDFKVVDLVQPVAGTRLGGNVYTVFMPYYRDFGVFGVAIFMAFIGFIHSYINRLSRFGNPLVILLNGVFYYALLMQFFQDQYFSLLSQWIQMIFWMFILLWIKPIYSASSPRD